MVYVAKVESVTVHRIQVQRSGFERSEFKVRVIQISQRPVPSV